MESPLRKWRKERKLKQQELATAFGISPRIISQVETGQMDMPTVLRDRLATTAPDLLRAQATYWKMQAARIAERVA
jgi:transcriptional regulator with XRE-family HTH domain